MADDEVWFDTKSQDLNWTLQTVKMFYTLLVILLDRYSSDASQQQLC